MDYFPSSTAAAGEFGIGAKDGVVVQAVHAAGLTRVAYAPVIEDPNGSPLSKNERIFTCGDDYLVRILPCDMNSTFEPMVIDDATKPITWIDADADYLVTGGEDGSVRIYQHRQTTSEIDSESSDPTELVSVIARSSLPIRCVAIERFVANGKTPRVAICSDELSVRIVDAGDPARTQLLTGHSRSLRSASWHPKKAQLITCSCDGSIKIWDVSTTSPECIKTLDSALAFSSSQSEMASQAIYHPSGQYFVFPSKTHELVAINSNDFQRIGSFVVGSDSSIDLPTGEITSFGFCPNGKYLASATTDGKITIWESDTRRAIRSLHRNSVKTGLNWDPNRNALAWTDTMGQLNRWSDVVGSTYASPLGPVESIPTSSQIQGKTQRDDIDDLFGDVGMDEEIRDDDAGRTGARQTEQLSRTSRVQPRKERGVLNFDFASKSQETFQPTSTPMRSGRRFMCLNMIGSLIASEQAGEQSISFESHDASARRNWRFVDHFNYNLAAIGATGALFACPSKEGSNEYEDEDKDEDEDEEGDDEEKAKKKKGHTSSIYFKPFEAPGSWASSGSEWFLNLPKGEDAVAVAIGGKKCKSASSGAGVEHITAVVATSAGYLRFFSASGMQRYIWAIGSHVVSMAAGNKHLLIIHRGSTAVAIDQCQNLSYTVVDLLSLSVKQEGILPLTKGTTLSWLGFTELDYPVIFDSRQVLYILDRSLGAIGQARWIPVLDGAIKEGGSKVKYWPVGIEGSNLMTVFIKGSSLTYPDASSSTRPLIQQVELKMPLLNMDTPMGALEEQYLRNIQMASFIRAYQASLSEQDEEDMYDLVDLGNPVSLEHESDKALLQLVQLSCKSDKHQRVLDAAKELHTTRTLDAALQIGAFFHLSSLVDRMGGLRNWVKSRRDRDEEVAWSGINHGGSRSDVYRPETSSRILVESSQSPSLRNGIERNGIKKASLSNDFATRPKKSYGEGGRSDLAKAGQTPPSTWNSRAMSPEINRQSDKENLDEEIRGQKRRAGDEDGDDESAESGLESSVNPFANKTKKLSSTKNPFARTAGMTRDRSMHKSQSFFERVDASMDNTKNSNTAKGKAPKSKQSTLFDMTKHKSSATTAMTISPAFATDEESQDQSEVENEESIQLTLQNAAQKDQESIRLEETQYNNDMDSQYDSLPIDVAV